jgi:hypothetical protein
MLITYVTSLRARSLADDWDYHVWLLERTLHSMLAQGDQDVHVVVACHDVPHISVDPRVHFLQATFPVPARTNDDMCVDKVLKLSVGSEWAIGHGTKYVVFNDADDLVSAKLSRFIRDHDGANGWYTASEMFYKYGGRFMRSHIMGKTESGPCVIVRADLLTFDTPPFSGFWTELVARGGEADYLRLLARHGRRVNVLAAVGLGHYRQFMSHRCCPLEPLPFAANVIINHRDSTSFVSGGLGAYHPDVRAPTFRRVVKYLPTVRPVTASVRQEYFVPARRDIPKDYRRGGSIFWR